MSNPCSGGGLCCNRPLFDRFIFPCSREEIQTAEIKRWLQAKIQGRDMDGEKKEGRGAEKGKT